MFNAVSRLIHEWSQWKAYKAIPLVERGVVLYSEGAGYWTHFEPIVKHWLKSQQKQFVYLTSDINDPLILDPIDGVKAFYIGMGSIRTLLFSNMQAKLVVMTTPDLETYFIKRSPYVNHYAYIHHSIVSCHMIYREQAFDHFDSIFCVGPHHIDEIRGREKQAGLPAKKLIEHGYGRLDKLLKSIDGIKKRPLRPADVPGRVLIAPSWGENGLLERIGADFIGSLLEYGYQVVLRPHPRTRCLNPSVIDNIELRYSTKSHFRLDEDMSSSKSLFEADVMISDWSGAALEFAFAYERPVLFIDVPRKINNPRYLELGREPIEASIRHRIGRVLSEQELMSIADAVAGLVDAQIDMKTLKSERDRLVYNIGCSGKVGAEALVQLANL
jgi:hypothetical protein